jgi:hypothetical protein
VFFWNDAVRVGVPCVMVTWREPGDGVPIDVLLSDKLTDSEGLETERGINAVQV